LKCSGVLRLIESIERGLMHRGIAFVKVFIAKDPDYAMLRRSSLKS